MAYPWFQADGWVALHSSVRLATCGRLSIGLRGRQPPHSGVNNAAQLDKLPYK